jgi:hypothetical protein
MAGSSKIEKFRGRAREGSGWWERVWGGPGEPLQVEALNQVPTQKIYIYIFNVDFKKNLVWVIEW